MDFFLRFQKAHLEVAISKWLFDSLNPFWVKNLKEPNVCCCIYHLELEELKVGFDCMQKTFNLHAKNVFYCSCEEVCQVINDYNQGCITSKLTFLSLTKMWECIVCP